ncbi:low molecular weight phosphatase family protein [Georgenia sp. Z1344]|uniref:arsenate-mycothiol transferase ArsC n=1 Tax=Georgenia sp. Z1344 TaxID=3416706 RepID=UPI003CF85F4A
MAKAVRVQLLSRIIRDADWEVAAERLVGPGGEVEQIEEHLLDMCRTGVLDCRPAPDGQWLFSPTHDGLVRFGSVALEDVQEIPAPPTRAHERQLVRTSVALAEQYRGVFAPETVEKYVRESYALLASRASIRTHLPVLTQRFAADRLGALAQAEGLVRLPGLDILFVCVRNAGRSQIAAAVLRSLIGDRARIRTAGSAPAARIDPTVRTVLERRGLPLVTEFPRPLTDEIVRASDYVVTMGCGDACPIYPGRQYLDWPVADPANQPIHVVEVIADDITARVTGLVESAAVGR